MVLYQHGTVFIFSLGFDYGGNTPYQSLFFLKKVFLEN